MKRLGASSDTFDEEGSFVPENVPEPDAFLDGHDVLAGEDHVDFHATTWDLFEERGVYDMTFGYNLAKLNLDTRHPMAGFRYAEDADEDGVLRAEFTPTTEFCPAGNSLAIGAFRAWNGLSERHDYDLVRVRVAEMHNESESLNDDLQRLEDIFEETGEVPGPDALTEGSP
ncbi:hypothetical protein [Halorhabdus sp. BNX81]|uniref:hypothetical protein n=1 Tax=Halorhabdus sp. BNX81 TaxID=2980181 RepID=UPI0023DD263C|nr:hypothetical protein [Halorhabdus sp. BNX81]WEL21550.1 Uncharacterized protein HBNXHr_1488 [Halorhabdus sp. BNX81]